MAHRLTAAAALTIAACELVACAPSTNASRQKPASPKAAPTAPIEGVESDPPDESTYTQRAGQTHRVKLPNANATVLGRLTNSTATYVRVQAKPGVALESALLQTVTDAAGRPLVAAVYGQGGDGRLASSSDYELILRISKLAPSDGLHSLKWTASTSLDPRRTTGGYEQTLSIPSIENAPVQADLEHRFGEAMSNWFQSRSYEPFMSFAASRITHRLVKPASKDASNSVDRRRSQMELTQLMDFYTGRSSVRDSLQTERGLQLQHKAAALTLDPASIHVDPPIDRDYEKLVEKGMPAGASVVSPLATAMPNDTLVIEFSTLKDMIQLPHLLDQKLGAILRVVEENGGSNHLMERYRAQLGIELDGFAETVGQFAVKSVAVALGDPYLREGTDVSLVFRAENQALLANVLASHLSRAKSRHPDIATTQETVAGESVAVSTTPNGAIRRYEYSYGDLRIVSNSKGAITRFVQVKQGKLAKLADDKGYLGARRLAPYDPNRERAFIFFGDAFVTAVMSPRSRILEARRMRAQSELEALDNVALLYGWLEGKPAKTKSDLLDSGWAEKSDFTHSDGSTIEWTSAKGARSRWGYAKALVPIVDLPYGKISKDEADAFKSFRSWYTDAMNGRLDPTSFRVERTANDQGIATELRVFPIMPNGTFQREYREISQMVGEGRIEPSAKSRGATVALGVGEGSPLRSLSDDFIRDSFGSRDLNLNFVGDWVEAGWDEGSALWDIAATEHWIANINPDESDDHLRLKFDELIPKLPLWVAVNVKSRLVLAAVLTALRVKLEASTDGMAKWHKDLVYRAVPITRVHVKEDSSTDAVKANIYYAIAKDVLLVSLRREILKARIDDVLEGRTPKGGRLPPNPSQFVVDLAPVLDGWQRRAAHALLDMAALSAHGRACAGLEVLTRGLVNLPAEPMAKRELALRYLGYEPESPQAGELTWRDGLCEHPIYGTVLEPRVPDTKDPSVPLHAALSAIESLRFALGLIPRGDATELWARFQLNPSSKPTAK